MSEVIPLVHTAMAPEPPRSSGTTSTLELDNCSREEIRLPGSIQRHGFLLGLDPEHERIVVLSENAEEFLGSPTRLLLGGNIQNVLPQELLLAVRTLRCVIDPEGMVTYLGAYQIRNELFSVVTHCIEETRVLEFERQDRLVGPEMMNAVITNFVGTLSKLETEQELCEAVTRQIALLTGFDRVLLYSFDAEGHGTVLSETGNGLLPSYKGLRFPASDIPAQARELYVLNTVRIIPDATYTPSRLVRLQDAGPHILDLSLSTLRSVSPVHLEYMRNMGTMSSMSVSILSEGRLWGLISGHHSQPRTVPYLVRSACDMLTRLMGTQLQSMRTADRLRTTLRLHGTQRSVLTQIAAENNYLAALAGQIGTVLQVTDADGAVLVVDGEYVRSGNAPGEEEVRQLVQWLESRGETELFRTDQLRAVMGDAAPQDVSAGGMLAIRISDVRSRWLLWFRPEIVTTVKWAGEPVKDIDEHQQLHPRKSFATWQETVRGRSVPWSPEEIESAEDFRAALVTVSLQRAEEEAELSTARFLQLTHTLPTKVFTTDDHGHLTYVNERWHEHGLPSTGLWFGEGKLLPEDEERCRIAWEKAVDAGETFEEEVRLTPTPGGAPRWNLVRITPFRRMGRRPAGWVGIFLDLTERKEREAALRMTEKLALTGRMTSVIAHEINNPLESMTNLLYLLRQEIPGEGTAASYITLAESELERISGITKQTLRWSRETSETRQWLTAGSLFEDVQRLFRGKIRNRDVNVVVSGGTDVRIFAVVGQLRQVLANLVSNAVDASRSGGHVWLTAAAEPDGGVCLTVEDDGVGISPEAQAMLFQPFYSTKGDLGNGLGLYISKEIVERLHGSLQVTSTLGKGTRMLIRLPAPPSDAASSAASVSANGHNGNHFPHD